MMRIIFITIFLICLMCSFIHATDETIRFGRFGTVTLYRSSPHPTNVVLFVSGDGGWNKGVVDMARALSSLDALVVGIDIRRYLGEFKSSSEACSYPAADFEMLSKFVQKKLDFPKYRHPVLVGYSSGATLVYAVLVQAPPNTFLGAVSLGFCPDLQLTKPLCKGNGLEWKVGPKGKGYIFLPATGLKNPWVALQGTIDQVCDSEATEAYVKQVKDGEIILLPKVGHGFSVPRNWMTQFKEAFARITEKEKTDLSASVDELKDLPLVEVPSAGKDSNVLAVIISGDGGWAGIDRELGNTIASHGIPVVGLNSLYYFWTRRTPGGSAKDLERIILHYLSAWHKERVILIGYSLGADVLPFMVNRMPEEILKKVQVTALLGLDKTADFEFHITDWVDGAHAKTSLPVYPELEKLKELKVLCFYGKEEEDILCKSLKQSTAKVIPLKGAHHFGGDYKAIAEIILKEMK